MTVPFEADVVPQAAAISELTEKVMEYLVAAGVDARATHHVGLALDELLVNLGSHGGGAERPRPRAFRRRRIAESPLSSGQ